MKLKANSTRRYEPIKVSWVIQILNKPVSESRGKKKTSQQVLVTETKQRLKPCVCELLTVSIPSDKQATHMENASVQTQIPQRLHYPSLLAPPSQLRVWGEVTLIFISVKLIQASLPARQFKLRGRWIVVQNLTIYTQLTHSCQHF